MEREDLKSVLESLLFVADAPVPLERFSEILEGADNEEVGAALTELQADYENRRRGLRVVEVAGGFQLRTAKANSDWVKKFLGGRPARMGRATLETLAIIAYRQPITKAEIESIRGVDVDGVVNTLLERNLIRAVARQVRRVNQLLHFRRTDVVDRELFDDLSVLEHRLPTRNAVGGDLVAGRDHVERLDTLGAQVGALWQAGRRNNDIVARVQADHRRLIGRLDWGLHCFCLSLWRCCGLMPDGCLTGRMPSLTC